MLLTTVNDIEDKILLEQNGAILYVAQKDQLDYLSVIEDLSRKYGDFLNVALLVIDDLSAANADLKREFKSAKIPQFRFYPNLKTGQEKKDKSFEIMIAKNGDVEDVKETVFTELYENFETDVKDVSEKVYYQIGGANSRDGKITVVYMYASGSVDFTFKALSAEPYLQDDFVFMGLDGPSEQMRNNGILPAITGMLDVNEEFPTPRIFNFEGM